VKALLDKQAADLEPIVLDGWVRMLQVTVKCKKCRRPSADVQDLLGVILDRTGLPLGALMCVQRVDEGAIRVAKEQFHKRASKQAAAGQLWLLLEQPPFLDPIEMVCTNDGARSIERRTVLNALTTARRRDEQQQVFA
jgi:hypothetical protein